MKLAGNTVLVTGGATGIGLGIARRFVRAGSRVIVCGRREEKLRDARNVLVNNAGIQLRFSPADPPDWDRIREEIAINFDAPRT